MVYVEDKRKELKTIWPIEIGLISGTTKQTGDKYLHAQVGSTVRKMEKIGLGD